MNVLIISTNRLRHPMPVMPLGACMVAEATAAAGHRVHFLDLMFAPEPLAAVAAEIDWCKPAVIGLSVRNIDNNDMERPGFFLWELLPILEVIRRKSRAPVVLGGAAISVMPEEILRYTRAECAVCGEGEVVFPELIESLASGRMPRDLPGLAWIEEGKFCFNPPAQSGYARDCPVPDFRGWLRLGAYRRRLATVPLQTKLGCHFQCVYCTYRKIEGQSYRMLDPESAVESIKRLELLGLRDIELVDNVFNSPYRHAMAICEGLARARPRVRLQSLEINPAFVDDQLVAAMEKAGFVGMGLTVESASPAVLKGLKKGFSTEEVYGAAEVVSRHRLPCLWIFLFGGPGETRASVRETLTFAKFAIRPSDVAFFSSGIRIYPGTGLEKTARAQGVLPPAPGNLLEPVFYVSPEVEIEWIRKELRKAMASHLNFISGESIGFRHLPAINLCGQWVGLRPPLWKHSRLIRRGLRMLGVAA